jgi:hypothetical protein
MFSDRLLVALTSILFLTGGATIVYVFWGDEAVKLTSEFNFSTGKMDCVGQKVESKQEDEFMTGLVEKGSEMLVLKDYYDCNELKRGDIVSFRVSPPLQPVVKVVRAIGGDKFEIIPDEVSKKRYYIKVNGEYVTDRTGRFTIETPGKPALLTYQNARNGILKEDETMLLSNVSPGKADSASLGLLKSKLIEGKVILK